MNADTPYNGQRAPVTVLSVVYKGLEKQNMDRRNPDKGHHPTIADTAGNACAGQGLSDLEHNHKKFKRIVDLPRLPKTDHMPDVVLSVDHTGKVINVNQAVEAYGYTVKGLMGTSFMDLIHPNDRDRIANSFLDGLAEKKDHVRTQQFRALTQSNETVWIESNSIVRFTPKGEFLLWEGVCRDITDNIQTQYALLEAREALEAQVKVRTAELMQANEELQKEIWERRDKERLLMEREVDLEMEKTNLQETNTALKVLLKQRDTDKHGFEEQVMYNVKELILPYLDKLKATPLDDRQEAYLSILEANLGDLTSAFSRRLSLEFYGLTTSELKVANFIRQGKKTREIASLIGLSKRTIDAYRLSIRRKLRIKNKKANLRTLLMSME